MPTARDPAFAQAIHPGHAFLLAAGVPAYLGALLSDWAYRSSYEIQWSNFASWLLVGGLVFSIAALVWAIASFLRGRRVRHAVLYLLLSLATVVLAFFDALVHARDAWAMMPAGLLLSALVTLTAAAATVVGFSSLRAGGVP